MYGQVMHRAINDGCNSFYFLPRPARYGFNLLLFTTGREFHVEKASTRNMLKWMVTYMLGVSNFSGIRGEQGSPGKPRTPPKHEVGIA